MTARWLGLSALKFPPQTTPNLHTFLYSFLPYTQKLSVRFCIFLVNGESEEKLYRDEKIDILTMHKFDSMQFCPKFKVFVYAHLRPHLRFLLVRYYRKRNIFMGNYYFYQHPSTLYLFTLLKIY